MNRRGTDQVLKQTKRLASKTLITATPFMAEILPDGVPKPPSWTWRIQRIGRAEFLFWGREDSEEAATQCAKEALIRLLQNSVGMA